VRQGRDRQHQGDGGPVVEAIKSGADLLPKCQRARERETTRRQDDHQRKHRRPNPRRRQRDPKQSNGLSRSLIQHLRPGGKRTTPSRRRACGSLCQWIRWVATQPSGRRWTLGCVTRWSLVRVPDFSTDSLIPLNALYRPPSYLFHLR
jgi:hypothetical protein